MTLHLHCPSCDTPLEVEATLHDDDVNDYEPEACPECAHDLERACDRAVTAELRRAKWHGDPLDA